MNRLPAIALAGLMSLPLLSRCIMIEDNRKPVMFRGDANHSGVYYTEGLENLTGVKWSFQTGERIMSSPVLYGDRLYFGSGDGYLYSLNSETGSEAWKFKTGGAVSSSPAVVEDKVLFNSEDGNFYALDSDSGEEIWRFSTGGESFFSHKGLWGIPPKDKLMVDPWDFFISSPVIANGVVYFGSGDTNIYALDISSGREKWRFKTGDGVHSSPAVSSGVLYCGSWDSFVYALDAETGEEIWKFDTGQDDEARLYEGVQSSPLIYDKTVFIGTRSSKLQAIDSETGKLKWEYSTGGPWICTSPAAHNGVVYCGTSDGYNLLAFNTETGDMKFDFNAGAWVFSSPVIVKNLIYFGCHNGRLYAVNTVTGKKKWEFRTDASISNEGNYYTDDGMINAKAYPRPENPDKAYEFMVDNVNLRILSVGSIISSPIVRDGVIYFGSTDGKMYAIN